MESLLGSAGLEMKIVVKEEEDFLGVSMAELVRVGRV